VEVEAKYSVPDEATFQRLLEEEALFGFDLGSPLVSELHDLYLDTADRAVLRRGYALRIRRQDNRYLATIKGLGEATAGIHRREEEEIRLPAPLPPRNWPASAIRDRALQLCNSRPLSTLFAIEQVRYSRLVSLAGRVVAEMELDRVRVRLEDGVADAYLELEVELQPTGSMEDLTRLNTDLHEEWNLAWRDRSKFQRALALLDATEIPVEESAPDAAQREPVPEPGVVEFIATELPAQHVILLEHPGLEADDPMSEAGRKILRFHYRRMIYTEPGTRLGQDIEALHNMRVATRRMRAAFRVFGGYFQAKAIAPYRKGLKRTGRALGAVRDLDVFREKIEVYLDTLPESEQDSLDGLLAELEAQRAAARQRLLAYLDGRKYARFKERFGEFVETEGRDSLPALLEGREPRPYRVRHVAPVTIYERLAELRAHDEWVSVPQPPLERLHALRIACKHLRYTLEFFREVLGPRAKLPIQEVVAVQDHLGSLQDAVVASDISQEYLERGTWGQASQHSLPAPRAARRDPGVEAYLEARQQEMQQLVDTFPLVWDCLKRPGFSEMVARAVMGL